MKETRDDDEREKKDDDEGETKTRETHKAKSVGRSRITREIEEFGGKGPLDFVSVDEC